MFLICICSRSQQKILLSDDEEELFSPLTEGLGIEQIVHDLTSSEVTVNTATAPLSSVPSEPTSSSSQNLYMVTKSLGNELVVTPIVPGEILTGLVFLLYV